MSTEILYQWTALFTGNRCELKKNIRIDSGGYYASEKPEIIRTTLGSCVAVCLYDPFRRIGGMNHILLPGYNELNVKDRSARYGVNAMELLINRIMRLGGNRRNLVAKVFGGANVMARLTENYSIGAQNVKFVNEYLYNERIRIISHDVGGHDTRIIHFHTDTGDAFLRRLRSLELQRLVLKEEKHLKRVENEIEKPGEVDLF